MDGPAGAPGRCIFRTVQIAGTVQLYCMSFSVPRDRLVPLLFVTPPVPRAKRGV